MAQLDIRYSYHGSPTLEDFSLSDAFVRGLMGPIGSGKSSAAAVEIVNRGREQRKGPDGIARSRWVVVRNTFPELRDTTIKTFFQWFPPQYHGRYWENDKRFLIKSFEHTEIEVLFRALDRPEDIRKLLSLEVTGAWINEARETPWAIIDTLQGRLGRYPARKDGGPTWYGMWMDTNPPDVDSKWYKFFEETKHDPRFAQIFRQPGGMDKKAENLPNLPGGRRYYENLRQGKGDDWIKVYINAEYGFVLDGKAVFPEYNDRVHCQAVEPIQGLTVYRGWDFGLTPACSFSQILPDGRWLIFAEMTTDDMGIERFADEVLTHCGRAFPRDTRFEDIGDPAGEQRSQTDERSCFDIMQAKGIGIEGGDQSLIIRLESIRKPLRTLSSNGEPQFVLHPRCKKLRKGFKGGYHYKRVRGPGEIYRDKPNKNEFSHIMDGTEYVATKLFGGSLRGQYQEDDDFPEPDLYSDAGRSSVTGY